MLDPLVTGSTLDLSPLHVIAVVTAGMVIGLVGVGIRRFLTASVDELVDLGKQASGWLTATALRQRRMPEHPWFCDRCLSRNGEAASRCYACGATREEAEAPVPDADAPAGASAGRAQRTQRRG